MPAAKPEFHARKITRGKDTGQFRVTLKRGKRDLKVDLGVRRNRGDVKRICEAVNGAYPVIYI